MCLALRRSLTPQDDAEGELRRASNRPLLGFDWRRSVPVRHWRARSVPLAVGMCANRPFQGPEMGDWRTFGPLVAQEWPGVSPAELPLGVVALPDAARKPDAPSRRRSRQPAAAAASASNSPRP